METKPTECYNVTMKRTLSDEYIQPDARGRIQLPKELRGVRLFKMEKKEGVYELTPLRFVDEKVNPQKPPLWLTKEVDRYLKDVLFPTLSAFFEKTGVEGLSAAFLYGSRARGDALSNSDFDIGLLFEKYPSLDRRHEISDALQSLLKNEFLKLRSHGVSTEPSFHFFSSTFSDVDLPPIYYSIFVDGKNIWQHKQGWDRFYERLKKIMKKRKVRSQDQGKNRKWIWEIK